MSTERSEIGNRATHTKAAASVYVFQWMESKSTTSIILIVHSCICHPNNDMGPIFYLRTDARPTLRFEQASNPRPPGLKSTTLTTRPCEQTTVCRLHIHVITTVSAKSPLYVGHAEVNFKCPTWINLTSDNFFLS